MKINIVLGPFLAGLPAKTGAVEKVWQGIALQLKAAGHDVTLIEKRGVDRNNEPVSYRQVTGFARPKKLMTALLYDLVYSHRVLRALPPADVTVSNTFFMPSIVMRLQRLLFKKRLGKLVPNLQRMPKGQTRFFSGVAAVTTVSNASRARIVAEMGDLPLAQRVVVVPNPVDTNVFNEEGREPQNKKTILYAGRLAEEKGVTLLIDAFMRAREQGLSEEYELVIVGPHEVSLGGGGETYLKKCRDLAKDGPVTFKPMIADPKLLAEEMKRSTFFAYPSLAQEGETFGVSVLEGMACGSVPIVSDLDCFKDFVVADENGIVFERSGDAKANLIAALLRTQSSDEVERKSQNALKTSKDFSYEIVAQRYAKVFEEVIEYK